jgi:hypothetical protein
VAGVRERACLSGESAMICGGVGEAEAEVRVPGGRACVLAPASRGRTFAGGDGARGGVRGISAPAHACTYASPLGLADK